MNRSLINFIDPSAQIGKDSVVWHFAVVLGGVVIGDHVSVGSGSEIGRGSVIGDYSRIGAHVFLPPNSILEERVFLSPGVVCCDDKFPQCGNLNYEAAPPYFESGCAVGAGAVILPGVRVGCGAFIGAGAVVTKNVSPHEHVRGEPARVRSYSKIQEGVSLAIYAKELRV